MDHLHSASRTILSGYFSRFCAVLFSFLLTPVYIKMIGIESFAIVGLTFSVQAILFFLEGGIGASTSIETAQFLAQKKMKEIVNLFKTGEILYWSSAFFLLALFIGSSKWIAGFWLKQVPANVYDLHLIIPLMGGVALAQWPAIFYNSALLGLQRQDLVNRLTLGFVIVKGILPIAFLICIGPTVESFLIANILAGLAYSLGAAFCLRRFVSGTHLPSRFDFSVFSAIVKKSVTFSILGILGVLLIHVDKIILSRSLDLKLFGYYSISWIPIYGMYSFYSILITFFGPRFSYLIALNDQKDVIETYHQGCQWMAVLSIPSTVFFIFFSRPLLSFWMRDPVLAENTYILASLLLAGSCLSALCIIPQQFHISARRTRLAVILQISSVAAWIVLLVTLTKYVGIVGAGIAWTSLHLVYLCVSSFLMHRHQLAGERRRWFLQDTLMPLIGALAACSLCWALFSHRMHGFFGLVLLLMIALITFLASAMMAQSIRVTIIHVVKTHLYPTCLKSWLWAASKLPRLIDRK